MKFSRMWSCLLLLGAVLNFSGCEQIVKFFGGGGGGSGALHVTTATVSIKGCSVVDPTTAGVVDPIVEYPGTPLTWNFSDKTYVITFDTKYDPNNPSNNITPSVTYPTSHSAIWANAGTPTDCSIDNTTNKNKGCYFKYNIAVSGQKVCSDPGVQIIPN
jgi:hypothetical protein